MHPERLMTQRCILVVTTVDDDSDRDEYGNVVPTTLEVPDVPCFLQQSQAVAQRGESDGLGQIQSESFRILLPRVITRQDEDDETVQVVPDGIDSVTVDSISYEMVGPPWPVFNPRLRRVTHVEATVRRAA